MVRLGIALAAAISPGVTMSVRVATFAETLQKPLLDLLIRVPATSEASVSVLWAKWA